MRIQYYLVLLCFMLACGHSEDNTSANPAKSTVTIHLPFESSNYEDAKNFTLYDSSGNECVADLDTLTKGGGTIIYNSLPNGTYNYSIRTIFGEEVRRSISIDSSISVDFYNHCYDVREVIGSDALNTATKIDIIIERPEDMDTSKTDAFRFEKKGTRYSFQYTPDGSNGWSRPAFVDSAILLSALTDFEMVLIGLREMGIKEKEAGYIGTNVVYMKCDKQFLQIWNLNDHYLFTAVNRLKKVLIRK